METIQKSWSEPIIGDPAFVFETKLKRLKNILKEWSWKVFGNVNFQIKEAEVRVQKAMEKYYNNPFNEENLNELVEAQNVFNTKEVQLNAMMKQKERIADLLVSHFENKFKFKEVQVADSLLEVIPKYITKEDQSMLDSIPNTEEIKSIIFSMDPDSSPVPDGFSGCFYRAYWQIIVDDEAKNQNQFRTIGLSNVSFKIITKILTVRMSTLMEKLVAPQQEVSIKGRCIQEKVLLASEMVNEMKKKRRGGNVGLKLDNSQAYDSVIWEFIFQLLQKFSFSANWCDWLHKIFKSARISLLINGGPCGFFPVSRGLSQGEPLSPILFVLME
ncbi:uncharacterized protein LOC113295352 [Papaver somniferum]|uniref:uncharacterized protein LOC113295352 n=1 Tax=Papaver somniferum TaxID=3469 RepID=UPI000E703931|nr:uncharacterized protein LOC113295352 [Papaver somniferum]